MGDTINAAIHLLDHPQADTAELMKYCPGPDLPGGGIIVGLDGIREAYETGRGIFVTRARATIEQVTARKRGIVITELPYQVGPERVAEKLKESVSSGKVKGVSGWQDLSDRTHGMRLVVEVKNGFHPEAVLASLYKYTPLQESFGINTVALVDGQPRTLGLKAALQVFVDHRVEVTRRRSEFRLKKKQERLHLVDGLLIAVLNLDEVIEVIRTSDDSAAARQRLMTVFDLSEAQAEFILELRLRRLTKFSRLELEAEADELRQAIAELEQILASTEKLHDVVRSDMRQTAARLSTPRRTVLLEEDGSAVAASKDAALPVLGAMTVSDVPLEVPDVPCRIVLGADGRAIRLAHTGPVTRLEGFNSTIVGSILTHTRGSFGVVASSGFVVRLDVLSLPPGEKSSLADSAGASSATAAGSTETADTELSLAESAPLWSFDGAPQLSAAARLEDGETVVGILTLDEDETVGMMTARGIVKRMRPDYPSTQDRFSIINLEGTDQLIYAGACPDDAQIVMISTDAQLLRTPANKVRPQGRNAGGVAGMSLKEHTQVIAGAIVPDELVAATTVATVAAIMNAMPGANQSSIKLTPLDRYPVKGRGAQGVRVQRFLKGEYALDMAFVGPDPIHAIDAHGKQVKLPELDERRDGSGSNLKSNIAYFG